MEYRKLRVMISGGGTGGHIFPAVSIADALKKANPESEILFVGAEGRMEMQKVPAAGYRIVGLPVAGLQRKLTLHNIAENLRLPFRLLASLRKAGGLIREFRPDVVVGVGGYASAPLLWQASRRHIPTLIPYAPTYTPTRPKTGRKDWRTTGSGPATGSFWSWEEVSAAGRSTAR